MQLADKKRLNLETLHVLLEEVSSHTQIGYVELYGGEISLLDPEYLQGLVDTITKFYLGDISVITNLSAIPALFLQDNIIVSASYDFECREKNQLVFNNMLKFPRDIHVLVLATPCVIQSSVEDMIGTLNLLSNVKTVEIKPYSTNQSNAFDVSFKQYETFVQQWIASTTPKQFELTNELQIKQCIAHTKNAFSDDHLYITPSGKLAVLEFDLNNREYFLELENFDKYKVWCSREKDRVFKNSYCNKCEYLGCCLSEHLRNVTDITNSCNGFKHLIDWYKNAALEN